MIFALEKSTERLKRKYKKLGVTGNRTLIFADLADEQAHLLTCDQAVLLPFLFGRRGKKTPDRRLAHLFEFASARDELAEKLEQVYLLAG